MDVDDSVMDGSSDGTNEADITERFNQERVRMHRQLYSAISHDLKTPLASMIGALEIYERMKSKLPPEKQQSLIQTALSEAHRLDNFVTNILDMGKLENGLVPVRFESFDLGEAIKNCVASLSNRLRDSKVVIDTPDTKLIISSDASLLARALTVLIDNAVKYGGKPSTIHIAYGRTDLNQYMIHVRDNGSGIPDEQHESVFEKYTRFTKRDHQNAGTGLGLAICREITRLLGGTVHVSKSGGEGTIFTITIAADAA